MFSRVSSLTLGTCSVLLFSDAFSIEALIPTRSPRSEFAITLVTSRPEDAFIDLIANSIFGATMFSIAVKIALCILSSTVPTILLISLSILSLKRLSKVFTFITFSLTAVLLLELLTVKSRSFVPILTTAFSCLSLTALPIIISWSKSSNWLRSLLFDCLFLRVETMFVLITELYYKWAINNNMKSNECLNHKTSKVTIITRGKHQFLKSFNRLCLEITVFSSDFSSFSRVLPYSHLPFDSSTNRVLRTVDVILLTLFINKNIKRLLRITCRHHCITLIIGSKRT